MRFRRSFDAMPDQHEVVKFMPTAPPHKGDVVLVDGKRCVVTKARVTWEGNQWTIRRLRVRDAEHENA